MGKSIIISGADFSENCVREKANGFAYKELAFERGALYDETGLPDNTNLKGFRTKDFIIITGAKLFKTYGSDENGSSKPAMIPFFYAEDGTYIGQSFIFWNTNGGTFLHDDIIDLTKNFVGAAKVKLFFGDLNFSLSNIAKGGIEIE